MLYVFLWVLCGLAAGYVYKEHKNRSFFLGLLAGLLLGPVGLLFAAITKRAD